MKLVSLCLLNSKTPLQMSKIIVLDHIVQVLLRYKVVATSELGPKFRVVSAADGALPVIEFSCVVPTMSTVTHWCVCVFFFISRGWTLPILCSLVMFRSGQKIRLKQAMQSTASRGWRLCLLITDLSSSDIHENLARTDAVLSVFLQLSYCRLRRYILQGLSIFFGVSNPI